MATADRLLGQDEAAEFLHLSNPRTLAAWRFRRCGPPYVRLGVRAIRYRMCDLLAWVEMQAVKS